MVKLPSFEKEAFGEATIEKFDIGLGRMISAPIQMSRFSVGPGVATPWDQHEEQEVWVVVAGKGIVHEGDNSVQVGPGDAIHFAPQILHRVQNETDLPLLITSLWW